MLGPVLFSVFTGNLENGEVRKITKNTQLFRVVRTSTNWEELQRNHTQPKKKIPESVYSGTGKCSEKGATGDER